MSSAEFRRIALSFAGAEERQHMGHPDFRVGGKIFATLGYPDDRFGTLNVSPEDQAILVQSHPKAFKPAAGAWGRSGSTSVLLRLAPHRVVKDALEAAWERRATAPKRKRATGPTSQRTARRRPDGA